MSMEAEGAGSVVDRQRGATTLDTKPSAWGSVKSGWKVTLGSFWRLLGVFFLALLLPYAVLVVAVSPYGLLLEEFAIVSEGSPLGWLLGGIVIAGMVLAVYVWLLAVQGWFKEGLSHVRDRAGPFSFRGFLQQDRTLSLLGTYFLVGLSVTVGLLFLIIPGIWLATRLIFAPIAVVDQGLGPVGGLRESWRLTRGHSLNILGLLILVALVAWSGILALGIGILFTWIWGYGVTPLVHYDRLLRTRAPEMTRGDAAHG